METDVVRTQRELEKYRGVEETRRKRAVKAKALREKLGIGPEAELGAVFHTSVGDIRCELWPDVAPVTVENFTGLAEGTKEWTDPRTEATRTDPLYNGTIFHRIIRDFMIQGGDPLGNGRGGPGYRFEDEFDPDVRFDRVGLLAMANSGPGTNGSQFFITDSKPAHLNNKHTIFGSCDMPVVKAIITAPVKGEGRSASVPVEPVVLNSIELQRG
ncbi:MAG: peptidylprolyl isomerase [Proteobacteria bacterium]|nr:peptidylprolyl isomerase [Pseudomonadota bacterium]